MPTTRLAQPIPTYIAAANAQDIGSVTACFSEGAVVHDEKQDRQGIAAIRKWAEGVSEKYRPNIEVLDARQIGGVTVVAGRVSGDFPNSPVELCYAFTLSGGKIERLEIT
jgi:hypothetical protein